MKPYQLLWGDHTLELGERTCVMGIVNITPDSFSDGGAFFDADAAVAHGEQLVRNGADIIDIGGESTRPFSEAVSADDELRRVLPVIERLHDRVRVPISIDTTKAVVARKAIEAGAAIINDVSALRTDADMAGVAAERDVPVILMHMRATPKTMQIDPVYDDVVKEIKTFMGRRIEYAVGSGVARNRLIVDPGIGFGKTVAHNLKLIHQLDQFEDLDVPILIGPSRKAFIRNLLKKNPEEEVAPDRPDVEIGTQAVLTAAILKGAHMVRVHDVALARATAALADAIMSVTRKS